MEDKLQPQVRAIKLYGEGTWLVIEVEDTSIQSSCTMYSHTKGGFGDITIRNIDKDFIQSLHDQLGELLTTWKISS